MPDPKFNPTGPRMMATPPVMYSHPCCPTPSTTASAPLLRTANRDRKSTRLNSSHLVISYAVFCLKKKKIQSAFTMSDIDNVYIIACCYSSHSVLVCASGSLFAASDVDSSRDFMYVDDCTLSICIT